ncbi:MAG TPA: T9SS type A sorting domain-containing protein [Flavobacteriales bacterium]|nr:T9SS type A sorting domain-containing protein [Flavobacteriales bacterium]
MPNHSFEEYDTCRVVNDVYYPDNGPLGWFSAAGTPDHFLNCLPYGTFNSAPHNFLAFQYPQDGECYAGVVTYRAIPPNIREYFMVQLVEPLVIGQQYYASFYAGVGWRGYPMNPPAWLYTNKMGMLFTMQSRQWVLNDPYPVPLNFAHVYSQATITDTVGWTLVSGSFVADSAYQYLMLGNHFDNTNTDTMHIEVQQFVAIGYMLFDNLCVSIAPNGCAMAAGTDGHTNDGPRLFPNPAHERVTVQGLIDGTGIIIHDAVGKLQWQGIAAGEYFQLEVEHWAKGMYVLHAEHAERRDSFKFVLIE